MAEAPGHDRPESVGSHCQPGPETTPLGGLVANYCSGNPSMLVQQLFDTGLLQDGRAGDPGSPKQLMIEDTPRDRETVGPEWMMAPQGELSVGGGASGAGHLHAFERKGASLLEDFYYAELRQDADRFGAHVLGAGLVSRKRGAIDDENRMTCPGQQRRGCAAGWAGPHHEHIDLAD
jgi:hypothetical protein